ncbi:MAG: hypothetical protein JWP25_7271 [Bradyrhizobium sp.]|nr:hypothetical protein [Bradyrhizobium sp.]
MMLTAADVWRPYVIPGVPGSGANQPDKAQIITWGTFLEALLTSGSGAGFAYANLALLSADLAHAAQTEAVVYGDVNPASNGTYAKVGASGSGSWTRIGDLPNAIVRLTVTGGTGSAIIATAPETPTVPGSKLYLLTPTAANTGATTISVNGAAAVSITSALGSSLAANALLNNSQVLMAWSVDHYQLLISVPVDATGVLNDALAAASAAAASATSAASSASALGNQVHQYDTRAQAIAATIPSGVSLVRLLGRGTAGDLGAGLYKKLSSAPGTVRSWHWQNTAASSWWQLDEPRVNPRMLGADGGGSVDDSAPLQDSFDYVSSLFLGGAVEGIPGDNYRFISNGSVTDLGLILKSGVTLRLNNATISLECTGNVYGIRMQSNSHIEGPGLVKTTISTSAGSQDIYHAPISIGTAYGEVTSTAALGPYINATRWSVRNLTVSSVRSGGGGHIVLLGGPSHGLIDRVEFPDNANTFGCINMDWGTVGSISSSNIPASRALWPASAYTVHPNNIDVRRLKIGNMSNAGSIPIRLSGVHDIRVDGVEIAGSQSYAIFHTAGDLGYELAQSSDIQRRRHRGIVFKNIDILACNNGAAIHYDAFADNVATAIAGGYSPNLPAINPCDIIFENIRGIGSFTGSATDGVDCHYAIGGTFRNLFLTGFLRGMYFGESAQRMRVEGGEINSCQQEGIYIGNTANPIEITIEGTWCWSNGIGGTYAGINVANGNRHTITRCRLGNFGEGFQDMGINVGSGCVDVEVSGNHTIAHAGGGPAYSLGTATSYGCVRLFTDNTVDSGGVSAPYSGLNIVPIRYDIGPAGLRRHFLTLRSTMGTTPSSGSWLAGDTVEFADPIASGFTGSKCTTAGAPGTWKNYGPISA